MLFPLFFLFGFSKLNFDLKNKNKKIMGKWTLLKVTNMRIAEIRAFDVGERK